MWTTHRTSRLFELLTRPALLFTPSLGIRLPFSLVGSGHEKHSQPHLSMRKRGQPIDPDPCLLSIDGLLDCLFATSNLVDQIYHDCKENDEEQAETPGYEQSPTLLAAGFFRKRIKPALSRLGDLRIKLSDFGLGKFIGRGACGVVRIVHEVAPPRSVYAMKSQYKGAWLHHDPEGAQLMLERTVLAQATATENPWLPHLHYAFQDEKHLHLVMDYEPGGDLYIFLTKVGHLLDADMISFYAAEAIEATHSLHRMGYIHCDLKPENFAIERSGHLKLLDFGSAIRLDSDGKCICPTMVGTKEYLNIELLRQRGRHNEEPLLVGPEYDYWAIGVLLYELFYSHTPFYDEDEDAMMQKIMDYKRTLRFPSGIDISEDAIHLIRSLITTPSKRLTYEGLVGHSFFRNIDFATLRQTTPPYLPPVGDMDDVSNFSGGGDRRRDEAIMDVSTNHTFSPVRGKDSCSGSLRRSAMGEASRASVEDTVLPTDPAPQNISGPTEPAPYDLNSQMSEPPKESQHMPLTERELKELAIREAAAIPIHEEIEAIEDIEWDGSDCVRNLPFIGYTFTPGLVLLRKLTGAQAAATLAAGLGTNLMTTGAALDVDMTVSKPHPTPARKSIILSSALNVLATLPDKENQPTCIPPQCQFELTQKLAQLQQLHTELELRVKQSSPEHSEHAKEVQERLTRAVENSSDLAACNEAIHAVLSSMLSRERHIFDNLVKQLERLHKENMQLSSSANEDLRNRIMVDNARLKQITQLETQLERLRVNNSQLMTQRDEANEQIRELNAALARERELGEVTQQASESEIFRLTTITKQQGKLIDHMCSFLPPEHRPVGNLNPDAFTLIRDRSHVHGKLSTVKSLGHRAFKTGTRRTGGGLTTTDSSFPNSGGVGAPLLAAASAFFSRRRMVTPTEAEKPDGYSDSTPHTLTKQPSRLQRFVRKSGLKFRRRTVISPRPATNGATESDQIFTDDDDYGHNGGALAFYSSGSANDFDDLDNELPIHVPCGRHTLLPTCDNLSTEDSISSGPSTTSSAPSGPIHIPEYKSSWPRLRSKTRVGWAQGAQEIQFTSRSTLTKHRSHPRLLKQLSKVLGKGKPSSGTSETTPHR